MRWIARVSVGLLLGSAVLFSAPAAYSQSSPPAPATEEALLTLASEGKTVTVTASEVAKLPRTTLQIENKDKGNVKFEGVSLVELVRLAGGAPLGENFRHHEPPTWYVIVEAKDGYRVLFALSELDSAFTDKVVLLADRKDGQALSAEEGPFRIVVPGEKRRARWARQVTGLRVGRL